MNKHFLKNIRDNIPEPLKYLTAPVFRNKLLGNAHFKQCYALLESNKNQSEEAVKAYQLSQLKTILSYAYKNVPYYTDLFDKIKFNVAQMTSLEDIGVIPFLTKELINENFDKLISKEKVEGGFYVATTGGTTGVPLKVLLDYSSIFKENAFVYHFRKQLGYRFTDRLATFRGVEFGDKLWKYNPMQNELVFSPFKLSAVTLHQYLKKIKAFNPQYLNGYLSCVYFFAKLLKENNIRLDLDLKGIFLISENIDAEQRQFVEEFFNVKTSTFYGHSERCVIAEEVKDGLYKVSPYYGYTELIGQEENAYEIVSTGFLNKTMPLIRYKTGDLCTQEKGLISIQGRWNVDDYILGFKDEKITHASFNFHSNIFRNVTNYQFVQVAKGKVDLLLIVNKEFKREEIAAMKKEIDKKTREAVDFNIKIVDTLLLSKRGKFKRFISDIKDK